MLVSVSTTNAAGNCIGKCFPGERQQGKMGASVSNLLSNLGDPGDTDMFSYFATDKELRRAYFEGKKFDAKGEESVIEWLTVGKEVTGFPACVFIYRQVF